MSETLAHLFHRVAADSAAVHHPITWMQLADAAIIEGLKHPDHGRDILTLADRLRLAYAAQIREQGGPTDPDWSYIAAAAVDAGWEQHYRRPTAHRHPTAGKEITSIRYANGHQP